MDGLLTCELELGEPPPTSQMDRERINCAFSDYSPYGHGLFGGLACFRGNKAGYRAVACKDDLFDVWNTMTKIRSGDGAGGSTFWNPGDKPVPLIVTAEELVPQVGQARAFPRLANDQEQMAILRLYVQDLDIGLSTCLDVEELSLTVLTDVDHDRPRRLTPAVRNQRSNLGPCAELVELGFEQ